MTHKLTRRKTISLSAGCLASFGLKGCATDETAYFKALAEMTQPLPVNVEPRDLIRYATLAANGHNTQPWWFQLRDRRIDILPDFSRRTATVDPDDHHLFASLGCAAENLSLAARARGLSGDVRFDATGDGRAMIDLDDAPRGETALFAVIPERQCTRAPYDGRSVPQDVMRRLRAAATAYNVDVVVATDQSDIENMLELVIAGNSRQVDDPAFVSELKEWIRFNPDTAAAKRDGLYSASSGNPSLPDWLGPLFFDLFFTKDSENDKYAEHVRTSAGIITWIARSNDKKGWFDAGRSYQRFALQATADGLKHAFLNQAVEVLDVRRDLQTYLQVGNSRPNLIVRFGYGQNLPKSLRRPVSDVLI